MRIFHPLMLSNTVNIIAGIDSLQELEPLLLNMDCKNPFVIMSKGASTFGVGDMFIKDNRAEVLSVQYTTIIVSTTEISTTSVNSLVEQYKVGRCDSLIALGGGTIIDLVKLVKLSLLGIPTAQVHFEGTCILEEEERALPNLPLIAIPTTIGSGSGASQVAYVYSPEVNRPLRFDHHALLPHSVILDPKLSKTVPSIQTAMSVAAILGRAMESITSALSGPVSESYACHALRLLHEHSFRVIHTPHDLEARLGIAIASHLVGIAASMTRGGLAHVTALTLEKIVHIPYGQSMLIMLPHTLRYISDSSTEALERMAITVGICEKKPDKNSQQLVADALAGITWVNNFLTSITASMSPALPRKFYDILDNEKKQRLLRPEQLEDFASKILDNTDLLSNKRLPTLSEIVSILEAAYWGYPLNQDTSREYTI